jgi:sugar lactone lactonase YvrE
MAGMAVGVRATFGITLLALVLASCCLEVGPDTAIGPSGGGNTAGSAGGQGNFPTSFDDTILAGGGGGAEDGRGTNARFESPRGLAIDASGNLYVADYEAGIRRVDPSGNVTTVLTGGHCGSRDMLLGDQDGPFDVKVDSAGNLYEALANCVRKIDPSGAVTTVAGNGASGPIDGTGGPSGTAEFAYVSGIALDPAGNIFVADSDAHRVRKIALDGTVTTVAGSGVQGFVNGPGNSAEFEGPSSLAVDAAGNILASDGYRIRKVDNLGNVTTLAGNGMAGFQDGAGGASGTAEFNGLTGVTIDAAGNVLVADYGNDRVRRIDLAGNVTTVAGNGPSLTGDFSEPPNVEFYLPTCIAVDAAEDIYVGDFNDGLIHKLTPSP